MLKKRFSLLWNMHQKAHGNISTDLRDLLVIHKQKLQKIFLHLANQLSGKRLNLIYHFEPSNNK